MRIPLIDIGDDLAVSVGPVTVRLSPAQGLDLAERLTRKAFRRMMAEEKSALEHADAAKRAGRGEKR